jgi:hypothetical protein
VRYVLERIIAPELYPVTVAEAKRHLGEYVGATDRDDDISEMIAAATDWAESFTGRSLFDQTWRLTVDERATAAADSAQQSSSYIVGDTDWARDGIYLRRSPVLAVVSLKTVDAAGAETEVDAGTYALREETSKWPRLVGLNGTGWSTGTFRVTFRSGYADTTGSPQDDASVIPARFKQAIKMHVEAHYNRDADMERLLKAAENLLKPERCELGLA